MINQLFVVVKGPDLNNHVEERTRYDARVVTFCRARLFGLGQGAVCRSLFECSAKNVFHFHKPFSLSHHLLEVHLLLIFYTTIVQGQVSTPVSRTGPGYAKDPHQDRRPSVSDHDLTMGTLFPGICKRVKSSL